MPLPGYDAFASAWRQVPPLAAKAQHELLSTLPLLSGVEAFLAQEMPVPCSSLMSQSQVNGVGRRRDQAVFNQIPQ